jgi:hypothetical protein
MLTHFARLIIYSSEGDLPSLRSCQEKRNEGLKLLIKLPKSSDRKGDLVHGNGLTCAKPSGDVEELIVTRFKKTLSNPHSLTSRSTRATLNVSV